MFVWVCAFVIRSEDMIQTSYLAHLKGKAVDQMEFYHLWHGHMVFLSNILSQQSIFYCSLNVIKTKKNCFT